MRAHVARQLEVVHPIDLKRIDAIEPRAGPFDEVSNGVAVEGADVDEAFEVGQLDDVGREVLVVLADVHHQIRVFTAAQDPLDNGIEDVQRLLVVEQLTGFA